MKKAIVSVLSVVIVLSIFLIGGFFGDVFSLFEEAGTISGKATGVFYLYRDHYVQEVPAEADRQFVRLDYLKNSRITYRMFDEGLSIQTPNEHYLIRENGEVMIGTKKADTTVEYRSVDGEYYISLEDLSKIKGYEDFGISVGTADGFSILKNSYLSLDTARLSPKSYVFADPSHYDRYMVLKNKGETFKGEMRGQVPETTEIEGFHYSVTIEEKSYTYFISSNPEYTGYVDPSSLVKTGKTEAKAFPSGAPLSDVVLVWEAVYTDVVETSDIGEMPGLKTVSPTWYTLSDAAGTVSEIVDPEYIQWARARGYRIWPLIFNDSDIDLTHDFLMSYEAQNALIHYLADEAVRYGFEGYNLDFEHIYLADRDAYSHFVNMFCFEMKKWGIVTSVDVNVMDGADNWSKCFDHEVLGAVSDLLVIMAYDEHHATSEKAGSNSSYNWVDFHLKKILEIVPSHKVVLGVPFYTRVWESNAAGVTSEVLAMKDTDTFLQMYDFEVTWDEAARQRKAVSKGDGSVIEVWIEDATSLQHKAALVSEKKLAGIAAWRRGFESIEAWTAIGGASETPSDKEEGGTGR